MAKLFFFTLFITVLLSSPTFTEGDLFMQGFFKGIGSTASVNQSCPSFTIIWNHVGLLLKKNESSIEEGAGFLAKIMEEIIRNPFSSCGLLLNEADKVALILASYGERKRNISIDEQKMYLDLEYLVEAYKQNEYYEVGYYYGAALLELYSGNEIINQRELTPIPGNEYKQLLCGIYIGFIKENMKKEETKGNFDSQKICKQNWSFKLKDETNDIEILNFSKKKVLLFPNIKKIFADIKEMYEWDQEKDKQLQQLPTLPNSARDSFDSLVGLTTNKENYDSEDLKKAEKDEEIQIGGKSFKITQIWKKIDPIVKASQELLNELKNKNKTDNKKITKAEVLGNKFKDFASILKKK